MIEPKVFVPFPTSLERVRVLRRLNRFVVQVRKEEDGKSRSAEPLLLHVPNSGRMEELLTPDALGMATLDGGGERKTAGTLLLVHYNDRWVSVDARMPNRLFHEAVAQGALPPFRGYAVRRAEAPLGKGRIDFLLVSPGAPDFLVETKSCNLVEDGLALFPDAPTERGARHLDDLARAAKEGYRAAVVWFVQRDDARRLAAHRRADPQFKHALDAARAAGVETCAYRCDVRPEGITALGAIPVVG